MSYYKARLEQQRLAPKTDHAEFPVNALIEVTNACNHACVFCHNPFMKRSAGILDRETFRRFVNEAQPLGLREIGLYSTGEPFVVKDLDWFVRTAKEAGLTRVYVTTNGALSDLERVKACVAAGLDSLKFSINAGTRESYRLTHGKDDFEKVLANVRAIHEWRERDGIKLQMLGSFIYTKLTEADIPIHREVFGPYFEDTLVMAAKSQGGRTGANIEPIMTSHEHPDLADVGPCSMLWNRVHLTCEGYLTACCVDYEHDLTFADYAENAGKLAEMWNHPKIRELRQRHLDMRLEGTICKNCLFGTREEYAPISDLRGRFKKKGKFEDDTLARIRASVDHPPAVPAGPRK